MNILEVKEIEKKLAGKQILKKVSFCVKKWEIYGFLWPNGAWKTTTMKCIMGLITPEAGSISLLKQEGLTIDTKKRIGFMPENTYLYKHLTGKEFLNFNAKFFISDPSERQKKVAEVLKRVWMDHAWEKYLKEYSKWMLQRVWLAQSIINHPEILFLDEPMSGLDPIGRKMVKDLLISLRDEWTTIFFNTHILADVESICDKISIINKGRIIVQDKSLNDISWSLEDFFIEKIQSDNT